jgi:hypothetical protein
MAEYIEREALLNEIDTERDRLVALDMIGAEHILTHNARRIIEEAPAADVVEVKRGRWERVIPSKSAAKWSTKVCCSVCRMTGYTRYNFCPNCGADMRED